MAEVVEDFSLLHPAPEPVVDPEAVAAIEEGDRTRPDLPLLQQDEIAEEWRSPSAVVCAGARTPLIMLALRQAAMADSCSHCLQCSAYGGARRSSVIGDLHPTG